MQSGAMQCSAINSAINSDLNLPSQGLREGLPGSRAVAWAGLGEVTALQDLPEG